MVLLPGEHALLAPDWVPWGERIRPGDLGVGDLLPAAPDDARLVPAYLLSDDPAVEEVATELGLGRVRVMSREGRLDVAEEWHEGQFGPADDMATAAPAHCLSCAFLLPLAGSLGALFGACGNSYGPAAGRVVDVGYGCGAHSEVAVRMPLAVGRDRVGDRRVAPGSSPPPDTRAGTDQRVVTAADSADPFDSAALRRAVLAGWAASVHRFREDANAEEALAIGGYADRVVVELVANAVDAAAQAGEPARVLVRWLSESTGPVLAVANNGAPLTPAGVVGLSTLRASAKRDEARAVGRFGVGFTAVMSISDAPQVISAGGAVGFDRIATAAAVRGLAVPELVAELAGRADRVPALRLPWPIDRPPAVPEGFVTEVRLPVRPVAIDRARQAVDEIGPSLFWAFDGLAELAVQAPDHRQWCRRSDPNDPYLVNLDEGDRTSRYRVVTRSGRLVPELLADRPVEEQHRTGWRLSWVAPMAEPTALQVGESVAGLPGQWEEQARGGRAGPTRLGAPTPTDELLSFPAELVGTFPVDDTRRRLAAGPLTDHLLGEAAAGYLDLVLATPAAERIALIPQAVLPLGPVDAQVRAAVLMLLSRSPMLRSATGDPVAPVDAVLIPGLPAPAVELLAQAVPGLLPAGHRSIEIEALRLLGVRRLALAEAVSALSGLDRPAGFWQQVYRALDGSPADDLADLPVPLAGGGRRIGIRGVLLPAPGQPLARSDRSDRRDRCRPATRAPRRRAPATGTIGGPTCRRGRPVRGARAARGVPGLPGTAG